MVPSFAGPLGATCDIPCVNADDGWEEFLMNAAEIRLLRFLQAARARAHWMPYSTILNTEDLLPGDEKAVPTLLSRRLIEKDASQPAYRITDGGVKALQRRTDYL
jgi:RIO-like serine/threonine protein kinase